MPSNSSKMSKPLEPLKPPKLSKTYPQEVKEKPLPSISPYPRYDAYIRGEPLLQMPIAPPPNIDIFGDKSVFATFNIALMTVALGLPVKKVLQALGQSMTEQQFIQHMATYCAMAAGATDADLQVVRQGVMSVDDYTASELCDSLDVVAEIEDALGTTAQDKRTKIIKLENLLRLERDNVKRLQDLLDSKTRKRTMKEACMRAKWEIARGRAAEIVVDTYVSAALKHWGELEPTMQDKEREVRRAECERYILIEDIKEILWQIAFMSSLLLRLLVKHGIKYGVLLFVAWKVLSWL